MTPRAVRLLLHGVIDPDVDLHDPQQLAEIRPREWDLLLAVAVGGVAGAEARYALAELVPHGSGTWPWATLVTNLVGSALIGVLMALLAAHERPPRLVRPFLGTGVLGGFTTFSTFALDTHALLLAHRPGVALAYVAASLTGGLAATATTFALVRRLRGVR